jgi:hypothetical protein
MRKCQVAGCERIPEPGWTRCHAHVEVWLDRLFQEPHLMWRYDPEPPEITPDAHLDDWSPGELLEAFGR